MATQHIQQRAAQQLPAIAAHRPAQKLDRIMQKCGDFLLEQWATLIAAALGLLVFLAVSVPFLSYLGLDVIAKPIFFALHYVCAQIPSHSFYIDGHQLGLCARNLSIYSAMFLGSLAFTLSKKRLPGIPWWIWVLMMLPMAWDGTTQMFGLRESDWVLRVITGSLFGLGNVWFALPLMQRTLQNTPPAPRMPGTARYSSNLSAKRLQLLAAQRMRAQAMGVAYRRDSETAAVATPERLLTTSARTHQGENGPGKALVPHREEITRA